MDSVLATIKFNVYPDGMGDSYTGDMGGSFAAKGFAALSIRHVVIEVTQIVLANSLLDNLGTRSEVTADE